MADQLISVPAGDLANEPRPLDLLTAAMDRINAVYSRAAANSDGATRADCLVAIGVLRSLKKALS